MPDHRRLHDPTGWNEAARAAAAPTAGAAPLTAPYGLDALAALEGRPGERLLDVGCGAGGTAIAAARLGLTVTAVDFAPAMVAQASTQAANAGVSGLDIQVMDGQHLALLDGAFDLALSVFGVILFPDYRAGLAELRRVLRPGGRAAVVTWAPADRIGHMTVWTNAVRAEYPTFPGLEQPAGCLATDTPEKLQAEMATAGFEATEVRPLRHTWTVPSATWLAGNGDRFPLMDDLYARLGPGSRDRVRGRLLAILRARHGDAPFALPADAWLAVGTA